MSSRNIPVTTKSDWGCVPGLFHDDGRAESALERLKSAGFSQAEIGVATAGGREVGKHTGFWNKVTDLFGKHEHREPTAEIEDSLHACGLPEAQARYFNSSLAEGDVLLTVHASGDRAIRAREILESAGADLGTGGAATKTRTAPIQGERRIELVGEILRVHKERVPRGEARLRKEVVTETQHVEVPVTREELVIERAPVERREASGQVGAGEKEIRVPLSEEQVRVEKKPVVTEEVRVGKKQVQSTKRVDDDVRHEELRTERESDVKDRATDKGKRVA